MVVIRVKYLDNTSEYFKVDDGDCLTGCEYLSMRNRDANVVVRIPMTSLKSWIVGESIEQIVNDLSKFEP